MEPAHFGALLTAAPRVSTGSIYLEQLR